MPDSSAMIARAIEQDKFSMWCFTAEELRAKNVVAQYSSAEGSMKLQHEMLDESSGIIGTELKMVFRPDKSVLIQGIPENKISAFLYQCLCAKEVYAKAENSGDFISAVTELDAHLRTGLNDAVIKEFFPNLWDHIQKEIACCDEGDVKQCSSGM